MARITIFTCPKPFATTPIAQIQHNAIQSWNELGPEVEVILVGDDDGVAEAAAHYGIRHIPEVKRNLLGTPLVSSVFAKARQSSRTSLLAYVNADLILMPDFVESALHVFGQTEAFLIVGQRWDLALDQPLRLSSRWKEELRKELGQRGNLHSPNGSDYFIFPRTCFTLLPDFAIGRSGWDNWMIYYGRKQGYRVIDASSSIRVVHQSHDYSHLPGGRSHHRLPESLKNIETSGGRRRMFILGDTDYTLQEGKLCRRRFQWKKLGHEMEVMAVLQFDSPFWAELIYAFNHPVKAIREWRAALIGCLRHKPHKA